jgi:hypothetical protein
MKFIIIGSTLCIIAYYFYSTNSEEFDLRKSIIGKWTVEENSKIGNAKLETKEINYFYESGKGAAIVTSQMTFDLPDSKLNKFALPPVNMSSNTQFEWSIASNILYTTDTLHKSVGNDLSSKMMLAKVKLKHKNKSPINNLSSKTYHIHAINEDHIELRMDNKVIPLRRLKR